jgi:hypothetical protein
MLNKQANGLFGWECKCEYTTKKIFVFAFHSNRIRSCLAKTMYSCDTVTLLPLVILHLEPHHMTPESTERLALN